MLTQKYSRTSISVFIGLSTDTKPTDCPNGSCFTEMDTGKKYRFDKASSTWYEQPSGGGGGGGTITVDTEMSDTSTNPVQNNVITNALSLKLDAEESVGEFTEGISMSTEVAIGPYRAEEIITATGAANSERFGNYTRNVSGGQYSHSEGNTTAATGDAAHSEGTKTIASGGASHAEGDSTKASGIDSHAEGYSTTASGNYSHAEGRNTKATGKYSHAEGISGEASGDQSHAEGYATHAEGIDAHAEGYATYATGIHSHSEGMNTTASGDYSHAEGNVTSASGNWSHSGGEGTSAGGKHSFAHGHGASATGDESTAFGYMAYANGARSFAVGSGTIAGSDNQAVFGKYNIEDTDDKYALIIGIGTRANNRANAAAIGWNGNIDASGILNDVSVNAIDIMLRMSSGQNILQYDYDKSGILTTAEPIDWQIGNWRFYYTRSLVDGKYVLTPVTEQTAWAPDTFYFIGWSVVNGNNEYVARINRYVSAGVTYELGISVFSPTGSSISAGSINFPINAKFMVPPYSSVALLGTKTENGILDGVRVFIGSPLDYDDGTGHVYTNSTSYPVNAGIYISLSYEWDAENHPFFTVYPALVDPAKVSSVSTNWPTGWEAYNGTYDMITGGSFAAANILGGTGVTVTASGDNVTIGLDLDSTIASGGTKPVASGTIYANKPGTVVYSGSTAKGEVFNTLTATGTNANTASGEGAHAEGKKTTASGSNAHAEGEGTTASGPQGSHAEGVATKALGFSSHAEGNTTTASSTAAHAEGRNTRAVGASSHAEGYYTVAQGDYQHAGGKFNISDTNNTYAWIIGNGTADNARSNAIAVDWNGKIYVNNSTVGVNVSELYDLPTTIIPDSADLNSYTTPGVFYSNGSTKTATLYHCPYTGGGFKLEVFYTWDVTRPVQRITIGGAKFYMRGMGTSSWNQWYEYGGTVASSQGNDPPAASLSMSGQPSGNQPDEPSNEEPTPDDPTPDEQTDR